MMTVTDANVDLRETPEEVLDLLRVQIPLYIKLKFHAQRQISLIVGDEMDSLLALLADRQRISAILGSNASRLKHVQGNWEDYRQGFTPTQRKEADRMLAEIRECLQQVIDLDEQAAKLLEARKQAAAGELRADASDRG